MVAFTDPKQIASSKGLGQNPGHLRSGKEESNRRCRCILDTLKEVNKVVHQLIPEKYRFSENNQAGMFPHPIAITCSQTREVFLPRPESSQKFHASCASRFAQPSLSKSR